MKWNVRITFRGFTRASLQPRPPSIVNGVAGHPFNSQPLSGSVFDIREEVIEVDIFWLSRSFTVGQEGRGQIFGAFRRVV